MFTHAPVGAAATERRDDEIGRVALADAAGVDRDVVGELHDPGGRHEDDAGAAGSGRSGLTGEVVGVGERGDEVS